MDENKKQESLRTIVDKQLDKVTGGADFAKYKGYVITCNNCHHKWESATQKPKQCEKCGSTDISVYSALE